MIDFLYNIIIFPLTQIIEITFAIVQRISKNYVIALIGVSAVITACTLPLYFIAEKWQQAERDLQKRLKQKVDKIKSAFKGDEQYMVLSTYYRQNHYHPLYAFRNSLSILIQIPFFIAAYTYISHLEAIQGVSFLFIRDLGEPDHFLSLGGFSLNILPILMTLINCASSTVYTKGLAVGDKIQVYGIALVFLVLLYNSPAGLVLYWTMNNIFSLAKNILAKIKYWKIIVYIPICLCAIFIIVHYIIRGFNLGHIRTNQLLVIGFCLLIFFIPLFVKLFQYTQNKISQIVNIEQSSVSTPYTYILSALILFVLCGLIIPGSLIASSVPEFSFLDSYTTPLPFIGTTLIQAFGIFILWPCCIYFLFSQKIKYALSLILALLCVSALTNTFLFPLNYGDITTSLIFSRPDIQAKFGSIIVNGLVTLGILGLFAYLLLSKRKFIFHSFQIIVLSALVIFGIINTYKINKDFKQYTHLRNEFSSSTLELSKLNPVYNFSKNGKNIIVFMIDSAVSGYIPYIFEEKPELLDNFSGFTYYPNCVSFGKHTRVAMPLIFGGYEYKPENTQKNFQHAMNKHNEAILMMPIIFLEKGYRVTVTDPTLANYSHVPDLNIFTPYPEISVQNTNGNYTSNYLHSHPELKLLSIPKLLNKVLIRFSFLRTSSPIFRILIYDKGKWLNRSGSLSDNQLTLSTIDNYSSLDYLPLITKITNDDVNTYTSMTNDLPHEASMFQMPDYVPAMDITDIGNSLFARDKNYHANIAALLLVGKWLKFLQAENIYDNTRIIIVSDHGTFASSHYTENMLLPNGDWLSSYHALLLVKDFNSRGNMATDTTFMTQADVPLIAMEGLITNPKNHFSGNAFQNDKENGIFITDAPNLQNATTTIAEDQWLHVHDNIFDINNWERVRK